jgi:hypothetical protein
MGGKRTLTFGYDTQPMADHMAVPHDVHIASMMICGVPTRVGNRLLLSASDSAWEAIRNLPPEIAALLTDELGNPEPSYGGFVQIADARVLALVEAHSYFSCFRAVHARYVDHVQTVS